MGVKNAMFSQAVNFGAFSPTPSPHFKNKKKKKTIV